MHAHAYAPWNVECEISVKFGVFRPSGATRITRCTNQADILDKRVRNGFTRVPDMALIGKWGIPYRSPQIFKLLKYARSRSLRWSMHAPIITVKLARSFGNTNHRFTDVGLCQISVGAEPKYFWPRRRNVGLYIAPIHVNLM